MQRDCEMQTERRRKNWWWWEGGKGDDADFTVANFKPIPIRNLHIVKFRMNVTYLPVPCSSIFTRFLRQRRTFHSSKGWVQKVSILLPVLTISTPVRVNSMLTEIDQYRHFTSFSMGLSAPELRWQTAVVFEHVTLNVTEGNIAVYWPKKNRQILVQADSVGRDRLVPIRPFLDLEAVARFGPIMISINIKSYWPFGLMSW